MDEIYFNVSHHGRHIFRTDKYYQGDLVEKMESVLREKFTRKDGYMITKHTKTSVGYSEELKDM